jgi:hypothetical protein
MHYRKVIVTVTVLCADVPRIRAITTLRRCTPRWPSCTTTWTPPGLLLPPEGRCASHRSCRGCRSALTLRASSRASGAHHLRIQRRAFHLAALTCEEVSPDARGTVQSAPRTPLSVDTVAVIAAPPPGATCRLAPLLLALTPVHDIWEWCTKQRFDVPNTWRCRNGGSVA